MKEKQNKRFAVTSMLQPTDTLLLIDTAMQACNIALYKDGQTVTSTEEMAFGQAEKLIPAINTHLKSQNCTYQDLSAIIVTTGPGGFTGLRVGLSSARALSTALNIPLYGITSFTALAATHNDQSDKELSVILDSKREELFYQSFTKTGAPLGAPQIGQWDTALNATLKDSKKQTDIITNLKTEHPNAHHYTYPDLEKVIAFALKHPEILQEKPEPLYMRDADISTPKKQYRKMKGEE